MLEAVKNVNSFLPSFIKAFLSIVCGGLYSWAILKGAGVSCHSFQIVTMTGLLLFSLQTKKLFWYLIFPLCTLLALYFPVGLHYGMPEYGHIASLFATDATESTDFISAIPFWHFVAPVFLIGALLLAKFLFGYFSIQFCSPRNFCFFLLAFLLSLLPILGWESARYEVTEYFRLIPWWKYTIFILLCVSFVFLLRQTPNSRRSVSIPTLITLAAFGIAYICGDFRPIYKGIKGTIVVLKENRLLKSLIKSNDWDIVASAPKHQINVLIIGESARRDYMHAYGYPVRNTDFMDSVPGTVFDGFISEGDETIPSLRRALTHSRPSGAEINYSLNIIGLAKKAGLSTSWFSNQGFSDSTPISAIGSLADRKKWNRVGYTRTWSDFDLLPLLRAEIQRPDEKPKLIVLHLNGSHPGVCGSVNPDQYISKVGDPYYKEAFCYVESIRNTDKLLGLIYDALKASKQTFSMLYFSDHGLSHSEMAGQLVIKHGHPSDRCRDIPLFQASSEDLQHVTVKGRRFGDSLTEGISHWLGIATKQIPTPKDLFAPGIDPDTHGHESLMKQRRLDPAINILEHQKETGSP